MISRLDSSSEQFLNGLALSQRDMYRAQRELTSGKRVNTVSDDPDQISALLEARADLETATQTKSNLGRVKTEVDTAEGAIASAVKLVDQAQVLSTQGATGTATAQTRASLADQLGSILNQLVGIANTTVEGRNIFSGDSDQSAAYAVDLSQPVPTGAYLGTPATRQARNLNGAQFSVSRTAQEIFDGAGAGESIFASINAIRLALKTNDTTAIQAALPDLKTASTYLNQQHAFYGGVQNNVNGALADADKTETSITARISSIEDADATEATLRLNEAILQQNAALQSRARLPRTSLFDYLG
jgi:flagellar hook-associated protein 3 FlgL